MRNKPTYLILFPILALGIALSFPLQIYILYKIPLTDIGKIFSMLTPINIITMLSLTISAVLTILMNKWVYKVIPFALSIIFINNAIVGLYGTDYTLIQVALSFILFAVSLAPFYKKDIRAVIVNPKLRWWKTPKRYNLARPLQIQSDLLEVYSESMNVSATGIFAKIKESEMIQSLHLDEIIKLTVLTDEPISLQAKVVRKCINNTQVPDGFGLEIIKDQNYKTKYLPWFKKVSN